LAAKGSIATSNGVPASSSWTWDRPTVAISGEVKMLLETFERSRGCTTSPSRCDIAMRPCCAATEASISTPVQSPAA
jgi:hypothetical protein